MNLTLPTSTDTFQKMSEKRKSLISKIKRKLKKFTFLIVILMMKSQKLSKKQAMNLKKVIRS